jgi:hypothetical protein
MTAWCSVLNKNKTKSDVISFFIFLPNVWDVADGLLEVFAPIFQNWNNNGFVLQLSSMLL